MMVSHRFLPPLIAASATILLAGCGQGAPHGSDAATASPAATSSTSPTPVEVTTTPPDDDIGDTAQPRGEVVKCPHGATAVTLDGKLPKDSDKRYTLDANAGQPVVMFLNDSGEHISFNVYGPGSGPGGPALFRGEDETGQARYDSTLPSDGVYLIQIYRTGARRDARVPYHLSMRVDPASDGPHPSGAPADHALRAITDYYDALDHGNYAAAYREWQGEGDASGKTLAQFRAGFANTRHTDVTIRNGGDQEGAAGSIYLTVPVTVNAVKTDGTHQRFTGDYVLVRVNDVPGSCPTQRRWHIHSADLKPAG